MSYLNKVIMMGRLTKNPELSFLPSQTPVVEFSLATTHKFKGGDGQEREDTCFIDCRMYGKRAEAIQRFFVKGKPIIIEGRLQLDCWDSPDGKKNYKHRIFVNEFTFVASDTRSTSDSQAAPPVPPADDDIPF